jgi:PAS domain S-box-containing protein
MNTATIKILLVEDSPSDADLLQQSLQQTGIGRFEFTWVESLGDALERLNEGTFDVLLLDLSLPDSSGPDTFRRARQAAPHMPIVVLTGVHDERVGLAAVHEGVQDYLVKGESDGRQIARAIRYAIERKQAEEQMRQQREWLRVTLTSIGDAVIAGDTDGRITFLNPVAESLTGWNSEEALGQPIQRVFQIINGQTREPAEDLVTRVLKENRVITLANHTALVRKDGREVAIEDSAAPIPDAAGRAAGVVLVFHDVTEKRRVQAALAAAHAEAVNEKNRLQAVMESLPVGVALLDAQGGHVQSNRAFDQVWGGPRPPTQSVADYAVYKAWWTDSGELVRPEEWASARVISTGETVVGQALQIQRFDGASAFVLNGAAPISDADGKIIGSAVAMMDITELRRSQKEREVTLELLRLVNECSGTRELIQAAAAFFQRQSGCEAIGIRLQQGDDYPYVETRGFPPELVLAENNLCSLDAAGQVVRDSGGNAVLAGMCGRVIRGQFDPSKPFFSAHGSFCTNSTTELLASTSEADRLALNWNRCDGEEYESVALIPLRVGETRLGLLRLNDRRKGVFPAGFIGAWERLADQFAAAVARLRAEEGLLQAKQEWERTFDSVPDLIAIVDAQHRIVRANRAMAQRLGLTTGQCAGLICFECVHGADGPPEICPHALTLRDGEEHVAEIHEDNLGGDFLVSTTPLRDAQGRIVGSAHVARDITGRKRAEEKIRHQNTVLEGINRILREALICESEEELGRICLRVVEEATQSKFGFIGEINAEGRLDDIAISDPGWEACGLGEPGQRREPGGFKIHGLYGRVLTDGKGFFTNDPQNHPDSVGVPEGHPPLTAFLGVPLKHDGKTIGMIAVGNREGGYRPQDLEALEALAVGVVQVFMRKRAERAVRASEERLRQAQRMESIGLLAGGVAHDFNNLLTSIMGNASMLREEAFEDSRKQLDAVLMAAEKAADLTRQLLAYAGKGRFVLETLNLSRIVREMTDLLRASMSKKVTLKLALKPDLPGVEADRGQLQQIVMNLVINGAEAIGEDQTGTVTIATRVEEVSEGAPIADEIKAEALAPGQYVCFEVADTGCGMDRETRKKIFDPFFTTKFMGRGLGLAALAGIVQGHHGAIQLETAPGQGTTFRVYLPAGAAVEVPRPSARKQDLRGTETILLVDDEAMVRDFSRDALERHGYRVLLAAEGREAVRIFEENAGKVGLVLLDLTMPVMGGDEAFNLLKSKAGGLKVIVMSGYSEAEVKKMFAGKGVSGFLQKPFTATRLAEEVRAVLTEAPGTESGLN